MTNKEAIEFLKYAMENPNPNGNLTDEHTQIVLQVINLAIKALEERPQSEWIPVTYRPMTEEEEKEFCEQHGIEEGSLEDWEKRVFTCPLPDDEQEILTSFGRYVQEDICSWDEYGCGLENHGDWDGIDAWMPKPEPYKKGGEEE